MPNILENATGWFNETTGQGGTFKTPPQVSPFPQDYTPVNPLPALPSDFAPPTALGTKVASKGSSTGTALTDPAGATTLAPANTDISSFASGIGDYFLRGVIIILGFIFVGVGLKALAPNVVADIRGIGR